jgi:DNA polymerase-4
VELFSIDEAFLDLTGMGKIFGSSRLVALSLKKQIYRQTGLTCSVGIAPNKLLAKLASDMEKPDGLVEIKKSDVPAILETLPVSDMCGVGVKMKDHLNKMGIYTCGQLGRYPVGLLVKRFGIIGQYLHNMGLGDDDNPVRPYDEEGSIKSMGHSHTLNRDTFSDFEVKRHILRLSEMVGRRLRQDGYAGRTITLVIRYADFTTFSRQRTLDCSVDTGKQIDQIASLLFKHFDISRGIRLIGVSVSGLVRNTQLSLLSLGIKKDEVTEAMDAINDRHGEFTVTWASVIDGEDQHKVITPGTRISGLSKVDS